MLGGLNNMLSGGAGPSTGGLVGGRLSNNGPITISPGIGYPVTSNGTMLGSGKWLSGVQGTSAFSAISNGGGTKTGNASLGSISSTIADGQADTCFYAFPGLVRLPNGTLVAAYCNQTTHTVLLKRSTDMGESWGAADEAFTDPQLIGDINLSVDSTLRLWLTYHTNNSGVYSQKFRIGAVDTGTGSISWSGETVMPQAFAHTNGTTSRVVETADGVMLWPIYGKNSSSPNTYWDAAVWRSTDRGATWAKVNLATGTGTGFGDVEGYTETDIAQAGDGTLIAIVRQDGPVEQVGSYWRTISSDNGATWSPVAEVLDVTYVGRPSLAMLASGGVLLVCRGASAYPTFQMSWDLGQTWSAPSSFGYSGTDYYDAVWPLSGGVIGVAIGHQVSTTPPYASVHYREITSGYGLFSGGRMRASGLAVDGTTVVALESSINSVQDGGTSYIQISNSGTNGGSSSYTGINFRSNYGVSTQYGYIQHEAYGSAAGKSRIRIGRFNGSAYVDTATLDDSGLTVSGTIKAAGYTVASLPAGIQGARAHVTDSSADVATGIGEVVAGGGSNTVPVFYDGQNWRIG